MSYFDRLESAANDHIIDADARNCALYRTDGGENGENDGFNKELKRTSAYVKNIDVSIARSATDAPGDYIGTTHETDIHNGDVLEWVNPRNKIRRWTVTGFEPTERHTLLTLAEVRDA